MEMHITVPILMT